MLQTNNEARILLALQAYKKNPNLSLRRAAKLYQVNYTTLLCRDKGVQVRANTIPKSRKISNLERKIVYSVYSGPKFTRISPCYWVVLKKWPADCLQAAMRHPSASGGLETLSSGTKSLRRVTFVNMTINELNAKIQILLTCSCGLQHRLRRRPSHLPLGV